LQKKEAMLQHRLSTSDVGEGAEASGRRKSFVTGAGMACISLV
jgi:hypothetical protein